MVERTTYGPPQEFIDWLRANYDEREVASWLGTYPTVMGNWRDDPTYQYWNMWFNPANQVLVSQLQGITGKDELTRAIQELLDTTEMTEDEAMAYYEFFEPQASLREKNYLELVGMPQEVRNYLNQWTSPDDLADRLVRITGLDDKTRSGIYRAVLKNAGLLTPSRVPDVEVREAAVRATRAGIKEAETAEKERLKKAEEEEQAALNAPRIEAAKKQYLPYLRIALDNAVKAGVFTQEQADSQFNYESSLIDRGFDLKDLPNYEQTLAEQPTPIKEAQRLANEQNRLAEEAETAAKLAAFTQGLPPEQQAAIRGLTLEQAKSVLGRTPEWEEYVRGVTAMAAAEEATRKQREAGWTRTPAEELRIQGLPWMSDFAARGGAVAPQPSYASIYEPFLAGTYAPGTRLREFIESEIPGIAESIKAKREDWWRRMNAPPQPSPFGEVEGETYADVVARLRGESGRLGELLLGKGIAPTMGGTPTAEGPAWAWQQGQNVINARLAELYGMGESGYQDYAVKRLGTTTKEEDPLLQALRETDFLKRYYRRPGAGTANRLTPSVRFR